MIPKDIQRVRDVVGNPRSIIGMLKRAMLLRVVRHSGRQFFNRVVKQRDRG